MILTNDIDSFYQCKPSDYGFLMDLKFSRGFDDFIFARNILSIILATSIEQDRKLLKLTFTDVCDVAIKNLERLYCIQLEITDIKANQLDGISYKVEDTENNMLSFFCNEFSANFLSLMD